MTTAYMHRPLMSPVIAACLNIAEVAGVPVGDGDAPDCNGPYIVVNWSSSRPYTGPLSSPEADSADRIQFSFIGFTREQSDSMRDSIRTALTVANLDAQFVSLSAGRRTLNLLLDIARPSEKNDRGLPNPIFISIDQYIVETTPTV